MGVCGAAEWVPDERKVSGMRAEQVARFGGPEVLVVGEVPDPVAEQGQAVDPGWVGRRVVAGTGVRGGYAIKPVIGPTSSGRPCC
jgi:hypothetical protein